MIVRFLSIYRNTREGVPPSQEDMAKMGTLIAECQAGGVLLSAEGCLPSGKGARVRQDKGTVTVTDGPFTEAKEIVGGFAILQTHTKEEAVVWTKRFLAVAGDGECELRELY
jgi:hypothetical protein